jgi:hypothetical protein
MLLFLLECAALINVYIFRRSVVIIIIITIIIIIILISSVPVKYQVRDEAPKLVQTV